MFLDVNNSVIQYGSFLAVGIDNKKHSTVTIMLEVNIDLGITSVLVSSVQLLITISEPTLR
jgi:hypothetical protein